MNSTQKIYYEDPFLKECNATVIDKRNGNQICLDKTVAYPEGGGQISDIGFLCFEKETVPFTDVQKGIGRVFSVPDFPTVNVDTPVYHNIDEKYYDSISVGQDVIVKIDVNRRIWTTLHHSALHLALMIASKLKGDLYSAIKGCNITEESGRLDFSMLQRFTVDDIDYINQELEKFIKEAIPVIVYSYEGEKEAWFWKCLDYVCPCGGTHVTNTNQLGHIVAKRKGIGKGSERLIVNVDNPTLSMADYH